MARASAHCSTGLPIGLRVYVRARTAASERRVERAAFADGDRRVMFVAEDGGRWIGCAGAVLEDGVPYVISMWVHPAQRGRGIGAEMLRAIAGWAHERGHTRLLLWVTEGNWIALNLYERMGFQRTGRTKPLPHTPSVLKLEYGVELIGGSAVLG